MHGGGLPLAGPASRGWLRIAPIRVPAARGEHGMFRVSCSAAGQPSRRRSQRLRQQPKPSLDREEALQRLQQRGEAEAQQEAGSQEPEQEEGEVFIDEEDRLVSPAALTADPGAGASPLLQPPFELAAATEEEGEAPSELERLKELLRRTPEKPQQQGSWQQQQQQQQQSGAASLATPPPRQGREVVEADEIREPGQAGPIREPSLEDLLGSEDLQAKPDSRQGALLDILNSGGEVEERILQYRDIIDEHMLQLLTKRIELAAALQQEDAVQGLQLLYRRLKAEVDRKAASPAMRLLDDLINILDPGDDDSGPPGASADGEGTAVPPLPALSAAPAQLLEARRAQAVARLQAAFGLGLPQDADVMTLASQLAEGGEQLAEGLFGEAVDPESFLGEVTSLLNRASAQREQLATHLRRLEAAPLAVQQAQQAQRVELQAALEQRDHALGLVREVLELVAAWRARQTQEQLRQLL